MSLRSSRPPGRPVRAHLEEIVSQLRELKSAVAVAVAALRAQNADLDEDVARLLRQTVGDKLQDQIEHLEALLRGLEPPARHKK